MGENKITVIATTACFLASVVLSTVALATPAWIIQEFQGQAQYGLFVACMGGTYKGMSKTFCGAASNVPSEWKATAALLIISTLILLCSTILSAMSYIRARFLSYSKWLAFAGSAFHSLSSLIFPLGFDGEPVGGKAFKLPDHTAVGFSYVLFIVSLLLIFIGELFALKILCPGDFRRD